jgi:hypothetical protein
LIPAQTAKPVEPGSPAPPPMPGRQV